MYVISTQYKHYQTKTILRQLRARSAWLQITEEIRIKKSRRSGIY